VVTADLMSQARDGDGDAFREMTEPPGLPSDPRHSSHKTRREQQASRTSDHLARDKNLLNLPPAVAEVVLFS
jgi:hypothetical protein